MAACSKVIAPTALELYRMRHTVYRLWLISQTSDYALRMTQLAIEQTKLAAARRARSDLPCAQHNLPRSVKCTTRSFTVSNHLDTEGTRTRVPTKSQTTERATDRRRGASERSTRSRCELECRATRGCGFRVHFLAAHCDHSHVDRGVAEVRDAKKILEAL